MNTYVFFTNQYLPKPGATGMCVHQLAKVLVERGNNVFSIVYDDNSSCSMYDGVKIIRVKTPFYLKKIENASKYIKKAQGVLSLLNKLVYLKKYPLRSKTLVKSYMEYGERIIKKNGSAVIVASYTPLEAVIAGMELKKKYPNRIKYVYYSTDTLSNEQGNEGILPSIYREKCGLKWERQLFERCDMIFIMECHAEYYKKKFLDYLPKMRVVNFPLFEKKIHVSKINNKRSNVVKFVYVGTLYRKMRNPQYIINVLSELAEKMDLEAYFLGGGDCDDILKAAEVKTNGRIKYIGIQPHDLALKYISSADVLLSIGNSDSFMAPSKIYEYMATGKQIIHIYKFDEDPCIKPLKKYGNTLIIKEDDSFDLEEIMKFVKENRLLKLSDIEPLFETSTPEYSVRLLEELQGEL